MPSVVTLVVVTKVAFPGEQSEVLPTALRPRLSSGCPSMSQLTSAFMGGLSFLLTGAISQGEPASPSFSKVLL